MGARRRSRECALQVLYILETSPDDEGRVEPEGDVPREVRLLQPADAERAPEAMERFFENFDAPEKTRESTERLVNGVMERIADIDALITEHSPKWRLDRMARVDRNVLRVSLFELLGDESLDAKIVIDEGVEIAKRFGAGSSASFVNGVLDALARKVRPGELQSFKGAS